MKTKLTTENKIDQQDVHADLYTPDKSKGLVVFFHGMAEHKERYVDLARYLVAYDCSVLLCDLRGHGESLFDGHIKGHFADQDGWELMIDDLHQLIKQAQTITSHDDFVLVGHSMGSIVARSYMKQQSKHVQGLILTGIPANPPLPKAVLLVSKILAKTNPRKPCELLYRNSFLAFDKKTASKQHLSWLSVRKDNVLSYQADPLCGFHFTNQGFFDLSKGIVDVLDYRHYQLENLPCKMWFIVGSLDVTSNLDQIQRLVDHYNALGYHNIQTSVIDGVAHEVLFDENKHTLWRQVADFIDFCIR